MGGLKDGLGGGTGVSGIEEEMTTDTLLTSTNRIYFRDSGLNIYSSTDGQLDIVADTTIALSGAVTADSTITATTGVQCTPVSRTPTTDGTGTGTIPDGTSIVSVVDASDANKIIVLPTPTPGNIVWLLTAADSTGFELRSNNPATVAINGGTGANAESAIASTTTLVRCVCVSSTAWICSYWDADGDEAKVEAAA